MPTTPPRGSGSPVHKWAPSPPGLVALFDQVVMTVPGAEQKMLFGYPAAFVSGNMFAGLHEHRFILRLSDIDRARLMKVDGAAPFEPMPGRPMKQYVVVPATMLDSGDALGEWLERARAFASDLPPASPRRNVGARTQLKKEK